MTMKDPKVTVSELIDYLSRFPGDEQVVLYGIEAEDDEAVVLQYVLTDMSIEDDEEWAEEPAEEPAEERNDN